MKVYVMTTSGGRWATNGLAFETVEDAEAYGSDLFSRWMLATDWVVVDGNSTEPLTDAELEERGILARR